jgi:hypothetical protein
VYRLIDAGGTWKYGDTVGNNPQFALTVDDECEVVIELIQEDSRGVKGKEIGQYELIIMEVYDNGGLPVQPGKRGKMINNVGMNSQEIHIQTTLKPSPKPYTLICTTFQPGVELAFTLRWYATKRLKLQAFNPSVTSGGGAAATSSSNSSSAIAVRSLKSAGVTNDEIASAQQGQVQLIKSKKPTVISTKKNSSASASASVNNSSERSASNTKARHSAAPIDMFDDNTIQDTSREHSHEDRDNHDHEQDPNFVHSPKWRPGKK